MERDTSVSTRVLKLGTRGSKLALIQAHEAAIALQRIGWQVDTVVISSTGDQDQTTPLHTFRDTGIFTRALDNALINNEIDIAVHSSKDIPTDLPTGVVIAAYLPRIDVRDALILRKDITINDLENNSFQFIIGTSCPRRTVQWQQSYPNCQVKSVRGNVDTRLQLLDDQQYDGIILAAAGLIRLGFRNRISTYLDWMMPAPGQGAIAICTRPELETELSLLNDPETFAAVTAERSFLTALGSGCSVPAGAWAHTTDNQLFIKALIAGKSARENLSIALSGPKTEPKALGSEAAKQLLQLGGKQLIAKH